MSPWIGVAISLVMLWCIVGWVMYRGGCNRRAESQEDRATDH